MFSELTEAYRFRYVIYNSVYFSLRQKYRRSVLGFSWSVVAPLMQNLIIGVVFYYLVRFDVPNYLAYLFAGAVIYNVISAVFVQAPLVMFRNEGFIKKIYVPKLVFIFEIVFLEFANFVLAFISLLPLALIFDQITVSAHYLFIPISVLLSLVFSSGIAIILSILAVYFKDIIHFVPVIMQALFFLTPILYPMSYAPETLRKIIKFNPLYYFVEIFRAPIVNNSLPSILDFCLCVFLAGVSSAFGVWLLKKYSNGIVFKL